MGVANRMTRLLLFGTFMFIASASFLTAVPPDGSGTKFGGEFFRLDVYHSRDLRRDLIKSLETNNFSDAERLAKSLAVIVPVDELPYEAALSYANAENANVEALDFAHLALQRQPRSLAARLYLLREAAEQRQYEALIAQYERLIEMRSLNSDLLSDALVGVFRESGDWPVLIEYLKKRPPSGHYLVKRLLNEQNAPAELRDLRSLISQYPSHQGSYLQLMLNNEGLEAAYLTWLALSNLSSEETQAMPFNQTFKTRPEPAPFNWSIHSGRSEFNDAGGLFVSYKGSEQPLFVKQTFSASPGEYTLKTEAIGRMTRNGGALEWRVHCASSKKQLASSIISLTKVSIRESFETNVSIPDAGCDFQTIELRGRAGAFPKTSRLTILSVALSEVEK